MLTGSSFGGGSFQRAVGPAGPVEYAQDHASPMHQNQTQPNGQAFPVVRDASQVASKKGGGATIAFVVALVVVLAGGAAAVLLLSKRDRQPVKSTPTAELQSSTPALPAEVASAKPPASASATSVLALPNASAEASATEPSSPDPKTTPPAHSAWPATSHAAPPPKGKPLVQPTNQPTSQPTAKPTSGRPITGDL